METSKSENNLLRIAVQKNGRLSEKSIALFKECGINLNTSVGSKLTARARNFPLELLFLRDDDIPGYVNDGVADAGVVGQNVVEEKNPDLSIKSPLGFAYCRLSIALPVSQDYQGIESLKDARIATSYPKTLGRYMESKGVPCRIQEISGSVEIAPGIGLADAICDLVSSGGTLQANRLKEVESIFTSEAVLVESPSLSPEKQAILDELAFRIKTVQNSVGQKYLLLNAPNQVIDQISELLPGAKSPSVMKLAVDGWSAIQTIVSEEAFWDVLPSLRELGAEGITLMPIEKMID